jgi:predicted PurR-regulated permease PerM
MNENKSINISITPGTIVMILFILLGFWFAYILKDLILVVLTAVIFASAIEPATRWLMKKGLPRIGGVVVIYLAVLLILSSFFYFFVPPLINETTDFFKTLPTYLDKLNISANDAVLATEGMSLGERLVQIQNVLKASSSGVIGFATTVFGGLMSFVLIIVLSFYFAVQDDGLDNFLKFITPPKHHDYMLNLWKRAQAKIGRWLQGQILLSVIAGVMVYVVLSVLNIPYALLLALLAGVLELIPVFGSILAAIPAVIIAFIDSGTTLAFLTIVAYIIVNQLQGNIIYPMVVQKVLGVPPLVIILAIIAGSQLAGFLGVLISVPVAAAVQEWVADIQREKQNLSESLKKV